MLWYLIENNGRTDPAEPWPVVHILRVRIDMHVQLDCIRFN